MPDIERQGYYRIGSGDVFDFVASLPLPIIPPSCVFGSIALYSTALRYARRCLWKGTTLAEMAMDCRKASICFSRLAEFLEKESGNASG